MIDCMFPEKVQLSSVTKADITAEWKIVHIFSDAEAAITHGTHSISCFSLFPEELLRDFTNQAWKSYVAQEISPILDDLGVKDENEREKEVGHAASNQGSGNADPVNHADDEDLPEGMPDELDAAAK